MSNSSISEIIIDKEYISELNKQYFRLDTHECSKTTSKNILSAYITGTFVHYTRETLKHLLEFHLGWSIKRTLHGCNVCLIGSIITPEIYTRLLAYDIKIYTELEAISLILNPCKLIYNGKFLNYINLSSYNNSYTNTHFIKKNELWNKLFNPINLFHIAGHQDELYEFYNFILYSNLNKPILIIYPPESGVYRAIELSLLSLNYELVFMDNINIKTEFKKQKNSKFNQIPSYKVEKITNSQIQLFNSINKFSIIFVKCKYNLTSIKINNINSMIVESQQPLWIGKINCSRKFTFYPPPYPALTYRIKDILTELNYSIEIKDIESLLRHCNTQGISSIESALPKLMFILAIPNNEINSKNDTEWYINNHLKLENYNESSNINILEDSLSIEFLDDQFQTIWDNLYNTTSNIIEFNNKLAIILWFYNIFNQVFVDDYADLLVSCTTSLTLYNI